jgi:hypothetical protein
MRMTLQVDVMFGDSVVMVRLRFEPQGCSID